MRRWPAIAVVVVAAACSKSESECAAIMRDPARGFEIVTSKTDDPVRIWETFERCVAPDGDVCDRAAVGGAMAPSMAISDGSGRAARQAEGWRQWAARCRTLPAEQQRCLQLSYQLGHPACAALVEQARATLQ